MRKIYGSTDLYIVVRNVDKCTEPGEIVKEFARILGDKLRGIEFLEDPVPEHDCVTFDRDAAEEIKPAIPPIGVKPRFIHDEQRLDEIEKAIVRFAGARWPIPDEVTEEYNELAERLKREKR